MTAANGVLADCHCHLNHPLFRDHLPEVLAQAANAGVRQIIVAGWDEESSHSALELATKYPMISAAIGLHPWYITEQVKLDWLPALLDSPLVVAVGEIGLDGTRHARATTAIQQEVFQQQLHLAQACRLPVIIHCLRKWQLLLAMLQNNRGVRGVLHGFAGSREVLRELIALGFSISFGPAILRTESRRAHEALIDTPVSSLLLESDAPFAQLPGEEHHYLEPAEIPMLLTQASQLRGEDPVYLAGQLANNYCALFGHRAG